MKKWCFLILIFMIIIVVIVGMTWKHYGQSIVQKMNLNVFKPSPTSVPEKYSEAINPWERIWQPNEYRYYVQSKTQQPKQKSLRATPLPEPTDTLHFMDNPQTDDYRNDNRPGYDPVFNPVGNPTKYQYYDAVNSDPAYARSFVQKPKQGHWKLFQNANEYNEGLWLNPIPDPTLMAPPVYFADGYEGDDSLISNTLLPTNKR